MAKTKIGAMLSIVFLCAAVVLWPACQGSTVLSQETDTKTGLESQTADHLTITFQGKESVIRLGQLMQLDAVTRNIAALPKEGEDKIYTQATGVLLEDLLQNFLQISQNDVSAITLIAGDGYSVEIDSKLLQTKEIILAYEMDGRPLGEDEKPLRVAIDDAFGMYWIRGLHKIEIGESP